MKKRVMALMMAVTMISSLPVFAATEEELKKYVLDAYEATISGDWDDAKDLCDQAIGADPGYASAYAVRSMIKYNLEDDPGASEDAQKAIELSPDGYLVDLAYHLLAILSFDLEADYPKALQYSNKAIDLARDAPLADYYDLRAEIYQALGNAELSEKDKARAAEIRG